MGEVKEKEGGGKGEVVEGHDSVAKVVLRLRSNDFFESPTKSP